MPAVAGVLFACSVYADSVVATHDWDPYPGSGGWTSEYGWVNLATPSSGGSSNSGFLSVTFTNTSGGPDSSWEDIVHTPATSLYAGTYTISNWFQFDFFASNVLPNGLQVRWSSTTNSYIWGAAIDGPSTTGIWETLRSPALANWDDWDIEPFGTEEQFLSDLNDIEWIGVYINRNTVAEQMYGIDDFDLMVPEPAEMLMLATALVAVLIWHRRRRADSTA